MANNVNVDVFPFAVQSLSKTSGSAIYGDTDSTDSDFLRNQVPLHANWSERSPYAEAAMTTCRHFQEIANSRLIKTFF